MEKVKDFVQHILSHNSLLAEHGDRIGVVLAGSRAVGYCVPSSDYDFFALCDHATYSHIARLAGVSASAGAVDILGNTEIPEFGDEARADMSLFDEDRVSRAFRNYNDVVIWMWTNSRTIIDRQGRIRDLKQSFNGYPREVLRQKLKRHWLRDYDLSLHGITYHAESRNIFSIVHALASKMAEFCRLCCLLEGKPFPYAKWLFRACQDTKLGKELTPIFDRVIALITGLDNDIEKNWSMVQEAVRSMDTDACDIMEDALVEWGFGRDWVHNAHRDLTDALFDELL